MDKTGREYESFVAKLQRAILNTEEISKQNNIEVEVRKKIIDNCGIEREFDVYWEYELAGLTYKTIIECKDYNSNVSVGEIDGILGKTDDIPGLKLVFATTKGYQSGAKLKAKHNNIELLLVREQDSSDWITQDGEPLIKNVSINIIYEPPTRILKIQPKLDREWAEKNSKIDITQPISIGALNNEIFIEDIVNSDRYSLYELADRLTPLHGETYGDFEIIEDYEHAFIVFPDIRLKLNSLEIHYSIDELIKKSIEIDYSKELLGVIEYLQRGRTQSIFKNGVVRSSFNSNQN